MENKNKYWKGLEELNNDPKFVTSKKNEFAQGIPLEEVLTDSDGELQSNRRDFLKYFGFSISAVALAACNRTPVKNAIPYIVKPENITPGIPNWYATTCGACSTGCSILVKTREGRPVKIEGNSESPVFKGGVCATGHASILGLYDNERLKAPRSGSNESTWKAVDADITKALASAKNIRIVTTTITSPSTKKAIAEFTAKYPSTKTVGYEAISYAALIEANRVAFGKAVVPSYNFDKANVIVSFGADFLGTWISPVEYTKGWAKNRKAENKKMSRHLHFESNLSLTGSNADYRFPIKPSMEGAVLLSIYNKVAAASGAPTFNVPTIELAVNSVDLAAKELIAAKGQSLVVSGSNNLDNQLLVAAINGLLGNIGTTIDLDNYSNQASGDDAAFEAFVADMESGAVDAVIFYNTNPAYSYYNADRFKKALAKVETSISTNASTDETGELCKFQTPDNHYLESWNDAEPKVGYFGLTQPTITNVFDTRQAQESLLTWAGNTTDFYTYVKNNWQSSILMAGEEAWNKALHDGFYIMAPKAVSSATSAPLSSEIANRVTVNYVNNKNNTELKLYTKVGLGDGTHANNPWLQELPDPISKVCWDNYLTIGKVTADKFQLKDGDVVTLAVGNNKIEGLPVLVQPGQANSTIGLAVGYGKTHGKVASHFGKGLGKNAFGLVSLENGNFKYNASEAITLTKTGDDYELAQTQTHHTIEGRNLLREASLNEYIKNPSAGNNEHAHIISLWEEHDSKGHKWGMAIDMNACTGCGACVVSCSAENNVPVVGRKEILNSREMHWIRIDRYYSFKDSKGVVTTKEKELDKKGSDVDYENVSVMYQPMMCQHCGHAPCETVCPVLATVHSSEGLNQMAYNRCVGTRYCANNCPYKVRRFNWFKYRENDQFDFHFNNDLGRMVINPDVTVRSRGVMEKCSFCVQRIQAGKLKAKIENRTMVDGDVKTACQQSCPADALVFGDMNDANSEISKLFKNERKYVLLEEYNVQPSVGYLTKIRNVNEPIAGEQKAPVAHHEEKHEPAKEAAHEAH
ncbi:MAG: TAT-variant-translocated molybdopterin oxidoreductase [Bacteroidota bacterium]